MKDVGFEEIKNKEKNFRLQGSMYLLGNDLLVVITGMQDHIGSITLAQQYSATINPNIRTKNAEDGTGKRISASISTLTQYHHRDDQLLTEFARNLSQKLKRVVAVIGGIHIDNISTDDIRILSEMMKELQLKIIYKVTAVQ